MELIENAKTEFLQAKEGMIKALATTPDGRINWAPAPTARTPVQQVAHSAAAIGHITDMLKGVPFAVQSTAEADKGFREWEQQFSTREEVLELLHQKSDAFVSWLDSVTPEQLQGTATLPFNLGTAPVQVMLSAPASHTRFHVAQMEYTQTIYGDQDWHLSA